MRWGGAYAVGRSRRTNAEGIARLAAELEPFGYRIQPVEVNGCLHLKSACCALGSGVVLANREWADTDVFHDVKVVEVPPEEAHAANVLAIGRTVLVAASFPRTAKLIENLGWTVRRLDISELMKAEAGLTCSTILL